MRCPEELHFTLLSSHPALAKSAASLGLSLDTPFFAKQKSRVVIPREIFFFWKYFEHSKMILELITSTLKMLKIDKITIYKTHRRRQLKVGINISKNI